MLRNSAKPQLKEASRAKSIYFMTWRWHFYAGLFVIPFMLMLSLTGLVMLFDDEIELSEELMQTHKALLKIKRFIKPQQYAIDDYHDSDSSLSQSKNLRLRHSVNTITRINETLDFFLSELEIIKGELRQYHAERMNQNTYLFSVIAAIFLPTSFLTGLLGVNVGGIPGTDSPIAFGLFCLGLVVIFGVEFWILSRLKFFSQS